MHSPNTINTYLFAVKRFVREAHEDRYIDDTLYAQFKAVRTVKLSANVGRLKPNARVRIGRQTMHELGLKLIQTYVDIGRELTLAQEEIAAYRDDGNGKGFKAWVVSELGITPQYANQLINVYEQFGERRLKVHTRLWVNVSSRIHP